MSLDELNGCRALIDRELYGFDAILHALGIVLIYDNYAPGAKLVDRLRGEQAHIGLYRVASIARAEEIMLIPGQIKPQFVITKSDAGLTIPGMEKRYQRIEQAGVRVVWESPEKWDLFAFQSALLLAAGGSLG